MQELNLQMIAEPIKNGLRILSSPKERFEELNGRTLESVVWDYLILLITSAIATGIFSLAYSIIWAIYLDIFVNVDIQYIRMINYSLGRSTSLIFLYLFLGTFLLFFISLIIKPFLRKIKYASLLKILFYSLTPLLLFSWIIPNPIPLGIWGLFLLAVGVKSYKPLEIKKDSIQKRD